MFSFLNDTHEKRLGARLRAALPDVPVFLSSEVLPEIREFERTSTTAVCAYVGPMLASYLARLQAATGSARPAAAACHGQQRRRPGRGGMPAHAGDGGGIRPGRRRGRGGAGRAAARASRTCCPSTWAAPPPRPASSPTAKWRSTAEYEVGGGTNGKRWIAGTGHPIRVPVIDLAEVSAGGGSIAWIDPGGALRVGPQQRGRAARARRLWPRRHAADGHRCERRARLSGLRCWTARCRSTAPRRSGRSPSMSRAARPRACRRPRRGIIDVVNANMATRCASSRSSAATTRATSA